MDPFTTLAAVSPDDLDEDNLDDEDEEDDLDDEEDDSDEDEEPEWYVRADGRAGACGMPS